VIRREASSLALFWAALISFAILVYVLLDGFDLGVGILTARPATRVFEAPC